MRAMVLTAPGEPLVARHCPQPPPRGRQVKIEVEACAVCRTDLHIMDGDLVAPRYPVIPGHEIVGRVVAAGDETGAGLIGARVGVPWLGGTCGQCPFCRSGRENLCDQPVFTGFTVAGGFAQYTVANPDFCLPIPSSYEAAAAAPLLCAGLIGYRSYRACGPAQRLGLYGFGAAAHLITQIAVADGREVFAFTRPGDHEGQAFARSLGAAWAGGSDTVPPHPIEAAIIFAPAGELVPTALAAVEKGGKVVCAGIHMSDIPGFPYHLLWGERHLESVANLTREDGRLFLAAAQAAGVKAEIECFSLEEANIAIARLRAGAISGAAVLVP